MKIAKKTIIATLILPVVILLSSWGYTGHHTINTRAALSFNQEMSEFQAWTDILAEHASDADYRKDEDPTEAPKHYIDIDNYSEFINQGRIPQTYDSVVSIHGSYFVIDNGILPWATIAAYDTLQACFSRGDWDKAVLTAADLGHYVADGHMPMHITKNYNGQYSGNNGIHSRYESTMINSYVSQIQYQGSPVSVIDDVNQYVFDYLYNNYMYVDSVLAADDYAKGISGNTHSSAYKTALWEKSESFTVPLFAHASHALAELIYSAWKTAGSPDMPPSAVGEINGENAFGLGQNFPNPFSGETQITFNLKDHNHARITVMDMQGNLVKVIADADFAAGSHEVTWKPAGVAPGTFLLIMQSGNHTSYRKVVFLGQ